MTDDELNDGRVNFYYSREKRLQRASQAVKDINEPYVPRKAGLFRTLTSTRPLRFLFLSVITICVAITILSRFLYVEGVREIGNNKVAVSVIGSGENSYITVRKTMLKSGGKSGNAAMPYAGPVDIAVALPDDGSQVYAERIYFGPGQEEIFRFVAPFKGKKLLLLMEAGSEQVHLTVASE